VIIIQQVLHYKLVKDLSLKIKARNLGEYERATKKTPKAEPEPEIIPAEEADEKEYLKALKK